MPTLHNIDPQTIPLPVQEGGKVSGRNRIKGPIWNLEEIQARLRSGALDLSDDNQVWVATGDCDDNLEQLKWTTGCHVKNFILLLRPEPRRSGGDYINTQWAQDGYQDWHLCDAYKARVDDITWTRDASAPAYYVKFSMNPEEDAVYLVLISCHLDQ